MIQIISAPGERLERTRQTPKRRASRASCSAFCRPNSPSRTHLARSGTSARPRPISPPQSLLGLRDLRSFTRPFDLSILFHSLFSPALFKVIHSPIQSSRPRSTPFRAAGLRAGEGTRRRLKLRATCRILRVEGSSRLHRRSCWLERLIDWFHRPFQALEGTSRPHCLQLEGARSAAQSRCAEDLGDPRGPVPLPQGAARTAGPSRRPLRARRSRRSFISFSLFFESFVRSFFLSFSLSLSLSFFLSLSRVINKVSDRLVGTNYY
mmetsp:Transcript_9677/g.17010  ORF Transcript_9677/g.17010 Transcript_9677/m.17010 type:complete len:265 (+) Transcript_9677:102-896(+)